MHENQLSALMFSVNVLYAFHRQFADFHRAWLLLLMTSLVYHGDRRNRVVYWLDQVAMAHVVLVGAFYVPDLPLMHQFISVFLCTHCGCLYNLYKEDDAMHTWIHVLATVGNLNIMRQIR